MYHELLSLSPIKKFSVLYMHICIVHTLCLPSFLRGAMHEWTERMRVCVLSKGKHERTPRARATFRTKMPRELRTTVIRYCDKSSNQVSFVLSFFSLRKRVYEAPTTNEERKSNSSVKICICTQRERQNDMLNKTIVS